MRHPACAFIPSFPPRSPRCGASDGPSFEARVADLGTRAAAGASRSRSGARLWPVPRPCLGCLSRIGQPPPPLRPLFWPPGVSGTDRNGRQQFKDAALCFSGCIRRVAYRATIWWRSGASKRTLILSGKMPSWAPSHPGLRSRRRSSLRRSGWTPCAYWSGVTSPRSPESSRAGALGHVQFMPGVSSCRGRRRGRPGGSIGSVDDAMVSAGAFCRGSVGQGSAGAGKCPYRRALTTAWPGGKTPFPCCLG